MLPKGWVESSIAEVATFVSRGRSPTYTAVSELPVVNQRCVRWTGVDQKHIKFVDEKTRLGWPNELLLSENDILWNSTGTGTIGRAALYKPLSGFKEVVADSHVTIVRAGEAVDPAYLFALIRSPAVQDILDKMQSGSTSQVELSRAAVLSTRVPLPPFAEQRRILTKLDTLIACLSRTRAELERIDTLIMRYRRTVLNITFQSKNLRPLADVTQSTFYGPRIAAEAYVSDGVPTLRTSDISDRGCLVLRDPPRVNVESADLKKWGLQDGDLIVTRTGGTIGKCAVYEAQIGPALPSAYLIRVRLDKNKVRPRFVLLFLQSIFGQKQLLAGRTATAQPNINANAIMSVKLPILPLNLQDKVIDYVDQTFSHTDRLEAEAVRIRALLKRLEALILASAFRGDLVSQDPADEPASILLARTRTKRAAAPILQRKRIPNAQARLRI